MTHLVEINPQIKLDPQLARKITEAARIALKRISKRKFTLSIAVVSSERIRSLNRQYRDKNKVTDVLSFAGGDLALCLAKARKQAKENKVPLESEVAMLVVHGVLHLFGHDHMKKKDALRMFRLQDKILKKVLGKQLPKTLSFTPE